MGSLKDLKSLGELKNVKLKLDGFSLDKQLLTAINIPTVTSIDFDNCPIIIDDEQWARS